MKIITFSDKIFKEKKQKPLTMGNLLREFLDNDKKFLTDH